MLSFLQIVVGGGVYLPISFLHISFQLLLFILSHLPPPHLHNPYHFIPPIHNDSYSIPSHPITSTTLAFPIPFYLSLSPKIPFPPILPYPFPFTSILIPPCPSPYIPSLPFPDNIQPTQFYHTQVRVFEIAIPFWPLA